MAVPLAVPDDVSDVWRPLTSTEVVRVARLIDKASALLRQKLPWVDARIAKFEADPTDPAGLDPTTVATVVATVVKRFMSNTAGAVSVGIGSANVSYALRGDKDVRGELMVSDADIEKLLAPSLTTPRLGTLKLVPRLAPFPFNQPTPDDSSAADEWVGAQAEDEALQFLADGEPL